jgi:hypothetical protein
MIANLKWTDPRHYKGGSPQKERNEPYSSTHPFRACYPLGAWSGTACSVKGNEFGFQKKQNTFFALLIEAAFFESDDRENSSGYELV